mmetsp:Transcript_15508/g.17230  ORF Transcript_15508/g.17230 Transcript_15508/m.17230 type:complete len:172 (-) Transcript_15508:104-619(-)
MKNILYFRYKEKKHDLFLLFLSSVIYKTSSIFLGILDKIFYPKATSFSYSKNMDDKGWIVFILVLVFDVITQGFYFFYIFYSIKNIDFKRYLFNILEGYELQHKYLEVSIFIKKSPFYNSDTVETLSASEKLIKNLSIRKNIQTDPNLFSICHEEDSSTESPKEYTRTFTT